jgi:hypothetical protein
MWGLAYSDPEGFAHVLQYIHALCDLSIPARVLGNLLLALDSSRVAGQRDHAVLQRKV